jgi:hypothetical protein
MADKQFQAAFEYTRSRNRGNDKKEVMIFDNGMVRIRFVDIYYLLHL